MLSLWSEVEPGKRSRYSDWLSAGRDLKGRELTLIQVVKTALGPTQPPIQWIPEVKRPGCEADHSLPANAEVKKMWIYTSSAPYAFIAYCLIS
jgi:hypothetical protein